MANKDIYHSKNYIFLNALTLLGYIALYPIITKNISPGLYGDYIFIYATASIVIAISNLGCRIGFRRNFFEYSKEIQIKNLLISIQVLIFIIFSILLTISLIFESYILGFIDVSTQVKSFWSLLIISLMMDSFSKYFLIYLENSKKSKTYFLIFFSKTYLYFVIVIVLILLGNGIKSVIYGLFYSNLFLLIVSFIVQFSGGIKKFKFDFKQIKDILKISIPSIPHLLFGRINSDIDKILISLLSNTVNTGIYAIGQSIAYSIFQIITSLDKVFVPQIYKLMFAHKQNKIADYLMPFLFFCTLLTIGLISMSNFIADNFLGKTYVGVELIIIIFSIYYFTLFFRKINGHQLVYLKKVWINTNIFFLNFFLNFTLNFPLIIFYGMYGAALATLLSSIISLIVSVTITNKWMDLNYNKSLIFNYYLFIFSSVFLQIIFIFSQLNTNYFIQFIISLILITSFMVFGVYKKIVNKNSLSEILKIKVTK